MTEYVFDVKCIKSYTTGGTTYWEKDKIYHCHTEDFVSFRVNRDDNLVKAAFAYFELSLTLFHDYFQISDTLSKLPCITEWMEDEFKNEVESTRFFEFVKEDVRRLSNSMNFMIADVVGCAIAYSLIYEREPDDGDILYVDYLNNKIASEHLRECG